MQPNTPTNPNPDNKDLGINDPDFLNSLTATLPILMAGPIPSFVTNTPAAIPIKPLTTKEEQDQKARAAEQNNLLRVPATSPFRFKQPDHGQTEGSSFFFGMSQEQLASPTPSSIPQPQTLTTPQQSSSVPSNNKIG